MLTRALALSALSLSLAACGVDPSAVEDDAPVGAAAEALGSCFGTSCDGRDPGATGCEADATTVAAAQIPPYGAVVIRYSPSCSAAWARTTSTVPMYLSAQISRNQPSYATAPTPTTAPALAVRGAMVGVSAGKAVVAVGRLGTSFGSYPYAGQTAKIF